MPLRPTPSAEAECRPSLRRAEVTQSRSGPAISLPPGYPSRRAKEQTIMTPELLAQIKAVVESGTVLVLAVLGVGARGPARLAGIQAGVGAGAVVGLAGLGGGAGGPERLAEIKAVVESGIVLVLAVLGVGARG